MKPICVPCQRFYRVKKNGFRFIEGMPKPGERPNPGVEEDDKWTAYKLWTGDLYQCEGCGSQIVSGFAKEPISEHWQDDFDETIHRAEVANAGFTLFRVNDC